MRIKPLKYKQTTSLAAAVATATLLDSTLVSGGLAVASVGAFVIQAETQSLRWRDDGTAPTASVGNIIPIGQSLIVYRPQFGNFQVIETAASAKANVVAYTGDGPIQIPPGFGGSVSITGTTTVDTELPAAAALADTVANPTVPGVGGFLMVWNGATWDRLKGTAAGGAVNTPAATEVHLGQVGGEAANPAAAQFTRPNDTTAYASGDIVANSVTAGSVTPLSFSVARVAAGSFFVRRGRIKKSTTTVTNAAFRIHLFSTSPTVATTGDNGVFTNVSSAANYLGYLDVTAMQQLADGAAGHGAPGVGSEITVKLGSGQTIYGLLEARGAYAPGAQETFDVSLDAVLN